MISDKKILIITTFFGHWSGALVDYIDLYYNLRQFYSVDFYIVIQISNKSRNMYIKLVDFFTRFYDDELSNDLKKHIIYSNENLNNNYDVIITKFYDLQINFYNFLTLNSKNRIIILHDFSFYFVNVKYNKYMCDILFGKNIKDIISSPSLNIHSVDGITYFNYCMGLSEYRLKHSNISYNGKLFDYDIDDYTLSKENNKFNVNNYSAIRFIRREHSINSPESIQYMEIKAKLIFEFIYYGKSVIYTTKNKSLDDGLTDYLRLFNIDDDIEQEIKIDKKELYDKLIKFDENNKLIGFIEQ